MKTLILGSTSPRRKEIMSFFKVPFIQDSPHFNEEEAPVLDDPVQYATSLAEGKARSLSEKYPHAMILGADTVVKMGETYYAKPSGREEAKAFLQAFSGQWQTVVTGLALVFEGKVWTDYEETRLKVNILSDDVIERYLNGCVWHDKAGGYSIMGQSSLLVERIDGSFYNVAGLPTGALARLLMKGNIDLWDHL